MTTTRLITATLILMAMTLAVSAQSLLTARPVPFTTVPPAQIQLGPDRATITFLYHDYMMGQRAWLQSEAVPPTGLAFEYEITYWAPSNVSIDPTDAPPIGYGTFAWRRLNDGREGQLAACDGDGGVATKPGDKFRIAVRPDDYVEMQAHPYSDLSMWAALLIRKLNPATVVIEEAPGYLASATGFLMRYFLERAGYHVEAVVLDPREYGELTGRSRTVIVAHSSEGFRWPAPMLPGTRTFAEVRDDESTVADQYFTPESKSWLTDHWAEQDRRGNGFTPPQLTSDATSVPVIKKRYFAQQGDGVVVKHPTKENCWRWLTLNEVRKLHGVPEGYDLFEDQSKTRAGEVLGQGVIVSLFHRIIEGVRA